MDRQNVFSPHPGILFSPNRERSSDTCSHRDKHGKHDAKGKEPRLKAHMSDSIYINVQQSKCIEAGSRRRVARSWGKALGVRA